MTEIWEDPCRWLDEREAEYKNRPCPGSRSDKDTYCPCACASMEDDPHCMWCCQPLEAHGTKEPA